MRRAVCPICGQPRIVRGDGRFGRHNIATDKEPAGTRPTDLVAPRLLMRAALCPGSDTDAGLW